MLVNIRCNLVQLRLLSVGAAVRLFIFIFNLVGEVGLEPTKA